MCVRSDLTDLTQVDERIWGSSNINLYTTKPRSTCELSVPTGTFLALSGSNRHTLACLKMVKSDTSSAQPNPQQIQAMIRPFICLPTWQDPSPVLKNGENLPNEDSVDGAYLDLPSDQSGKDRVKKGSLPECLYTCEIRTRGHVY
ncbi:vacuolar protein sorting-associated protein 62 [Artemisia annua]|uniref:Vacuolar protein sorting-associated protein 62 n=1 Tax=Artemisia annua TaxID=35608 RepID=A0A2U1LQF2_ARTAN|nr:vacuolar protein sorting-associated protein 62 [Artemisia annua]